MSLYIRCKFFFTDYLMQHPLIRYYLLQQKFREYLKPALTRQLAFINQPEKLNNNSKKILVPIIETSHYQVYQILALAKALEISIKRVMPNANVTVITTDMLPYGDKGGYANDWQVYEASPYEYTIKLEADMFLPQSIEYWWDVLKHRDLVVSSCMRNFKGEISDCRVYRKFIDDNQLPDVYNSITYFKKSDTAERFYKIVRDIFENWDKYKTILKCNSDEPVTTDWVYSLACHIMGTKETTLPTFTDMSMVHMKQFVNDLVSTDWTRELVYECLPNTFRVNTHPQIYPFHYHVKEFCDTLRSTYIWNIK